MGHSLWTQTRNIEGKVADPPQAFLDSKAMHQTQCMRHAFPTDQDLVRIWMLTVTKND